MVYSLLGTVDSGKAVEACRVWWEPLLVQELESCHSYLQMVKV